MGLQLDVTCLPMAPGVRAQLLGNGIRTLADFGDLRNAPISSAQLASLADLTEEDAAEVLRVASGAPAEAYSAAAIHSATALLMEEAELPVIPTSCSALDKLLGGGVACGRVLEFCGVPGVGKTQLGMQLAINAQLPPAFGGCNAEAVYIDTEGSFMAERAMDICQATAQHVKGTIQSWQAQGGGPGLQQAMREAQQCTAEGLMSRIQVMRAKDAAQQLACLQLLPEYLTAHPQVRLLVVDSVTFHFRQDMKDFSARARVLTGMAQQLMQIAEHFKIAVVLMNQVTTRVLGESVSHLVPALGESWGHAASTRVVLHWQGSERLAYVYKSSTVPCGSARYTVTAEGVRDCEPC